MKQVGRKQEDGGPGREHKVVQTVDVLPHVVPGPNAAFTCRRENGPSQRRICTSDQECLSHFFVLSYFFLFVTKSPFDRVDLTLIGHGMCSADLWSDLYVPHRPDQVCLNEPTVDVGSASRGCWGVFQKVPRWWTFAPRCVNGTDVF